MRQLLDRHRDQTVHAGGDRLRQFGDHLDALGLQPQGDRVGGQGAAQLGQGQHVVQIDLMGRDLRRQVARQVVTAEAIGRARDAILVNGVQQQYPAGVFDQLPDLRIVARSGVGFDAVDVAAATERGVLVTTTQGANDWAVADHAFGLMLALCHNIVSSDRVARGWGPWAT